MEAPKGLNLTRNVGRRVIAESVLLSRARQLLLLRVLQPDCNREVLLRLQHPQPGGAQ